MADYDFHQLSPHDLEILARDLLQADWGITLESFKSGKDAGIDLRYAATHDKIIVQCKHYIRTGLPGLLRDLKKEVIKVQRLQPTRYVLVTSVPLSQADKTAIVGIIGSKFLVPGDVIGQEGLNNLLGQHPEIEGKHFKLWLASRAVLDRVLHNAAVTQSEFKVRRVYQEARRYVLSDAYPRALKMLGDQGVVVIAGPPGVGKTILANLLLYEHLEKGYRPVIIQRDIEEGQNLFQEGERQVFYFDDFMGATFLGDRASITGNNDRVLLEFIAMVRATPKARFILTTREHIYAQAMGKSERLRNSELNDLRVFLRMPDYSFAQKARILYNHLYFSDLPAEYQNELLRDDFYLKIIKHEKFNPRIIEWLSSYRRVRNTPSKQYIHFVEGLLKDPSEIWRHAYEQEISEAGRTMLLTLFSLGGKTAGFILKPGFAALHGERSRQYGFPTRPEDFRSALREVAGAFIKPLEILNVAFGAEVIDPSVLDLLNAVVRDVPENAADIIAGAVNFDQIERIWSFAKATNGSPVMTCISQQGDRLANSVGQRMLDQRRVDLGKGNVGYRGATFERRLAVVIDMADRMPSSRFSDLVKPLFDRLFEEWRSESPQIIDTVNVLRVMDRIRSMTSDEIEKRQGDIRCALLAEIRKGCRSDEMREVVSILDAADNSMILATRTAFDVYRQSHFADDLRECRSRDQFDGLIEDLELFKEELGVNVDHLLEQVQEEKDEFEAHEEARADHMLDEWKERRHEERDSERSVSDMFGSLRDDRD